MSRTKLLTAIGAANKIVCVTYTNPFSAGHDSHQDVQIGIDTKTVACGSGHLANTDPGDIAITTSDASGPMRYITFGFVGHMIQESDAWASKGGQKWAYNFKYEPFTGALPLTPELSEKITALCMKHNAKRNNLFNSRLGGYGKGFKPVLLDLFADESIKITWSDKI